MLSTVRTIQSSSVQFLFFPLKPLVSSVSPLPSSIFPSFFVFAKAAYSLPPLPLSYLFCFRLLPPRSSPYFFHRSFSLCSPDPGVFLSLSLAQRSGYYPPFIRAHGVRDPGVRPVACRPSTTVAVPPAVRTIGRCQEWRKLFPSIPHNLKELSDRWQSLA